MEASGRELHQAAAGPGHLGRDPGPRPAAGPVPPPRPQVRRPEEQGRPQARHRRDRPHLLKIAYAVLKSGRPYEEPGPDFYARRHSAQARQDYLLRQLQKLNPGCVVTITPAEAG